MWCCCCCWILDEILIIWCCWWFMLLVFMIIKFVVKIELFLEVLWKMGELVICDGMMFLILVLYGFDCLLMSLNVWTNFRNKFGCLGIKIGVLGVKMEIFPESRIILKTVTTRHGELEVSDSCVNSPWRVIWWPWRVAQYNNSFLSFLGFWVDLNHSKPILLMYLNGIELSKPL